MAPCHARLSGVNSIDRRTSHRVRLAGLLAFVMTALSVFGLGQAVSAETPTEVIDFAADGGLYIAPSRLDAQPAQFADALAAARAADLNLLIVVPADAQPDARAFALRVRQADAELDAVLVVATDHLVYTSVSDDYSDAQLRAASAAEEAAGPELAADAFVRELTVELVVETPEMYGKLMNYGALLMVLLAAAAIAEILWRQVRKKTAA